MRKTILYKTNPVVKLKNGGGYWNNVTPVESNIYVPPKKPITFGGQKPFNADTAFKSKPFTVPKFKFNTGMEGVGKTTGSIYGKAVHKPFSANTAVPTPNVNAGGTKPVASLPGEKSGITADGAAQVGGQLATMGGTALDSTTDGDETTYTGKEKTGDIAGGALKGIGTGVGLASTATSLGVGTVAAGSTGLMAATMFGQAAIPVPVVGAAVGLVIGGIVGMFKSKKAKKKAKKAENARDNKLDAAQRASDRKALTTQDSELAGAPAPTSAGVNPTTGYGTGYMRKGGSFRYTIPKRGSDAMVGQKPPMPKKFKRGGKIKDTENIIPNGVLHEEFNELGDKGMPVVMCKNNTCKKEYEIERDEMIFTLDSTRKVEILTKKKDHKKLGKYVKEQILSNTHSFTDKFVDLNNYKPKNETIFN